MNIRPFVTVAALGLFALPVATCQDAGNEKQDGIPACEDMKKTASGLEWGILKKGDGGEGPSDGDTVEVHYTGWLTDGTKFDSSRDRGKTTKFGLNQVIKGWTEGLKLMTLGMRCKFIIPSDIAYGDAGRPPSIPKKATLVFDVELIKVIRMPKMRPANAEKQTELANGIKLEVVKIGTGSAIGEGNGVSLRYAIWGAKGQILDCTEKSGQKFGGTLDAQRWPFIKDLVKNMKVGGIVRADVPNALVQEAQTDTVWQLELVKVIALPKFRMPDVAKIITTQSGLKYEVIKQGEGVAPLLSSTVRAHYTGWLTDGTVFDSSHARDEPMDFPLTRVVKGWTEGLQLMQPGAKFLLQIPPELGYGSKIGGAVPPNSVMIFLVELIEVL